MTWPIIRRLACSSWLALFALATTQVAKSQELSNFQLLEFLTTTLKTASASEVKVALADTNVALEQLQRQLSDQALGVILRHEFQLDRLATELRKPLPDERALQSIEQSLRRTVPGKLQHGVDALRSRVASLSRQVGLTPARLAGTQRSIAAIRKHFQDGQLRQTRAGETELRTAYAELAEYHPSAVHIEALRKRLAGANFASLIKRDYVTSMSQQSFEIPVDFRDCKDGTSLRGNGQVSVALSLELPLSNVDSHMLVHATGIGQVLLAADRRRIHVCARLSPHIQAQQSLHVLPSRVSRDAPKIDANIKTQLTQVKIDGLLGQLRMVENVAAQAIQSRLTASEKSFSDQIEKIAFEQIEKEGLKLENKINGLIQQGMWDVIASLEYEPDVHLRNDKQGIRGEMHLADRQQLGALSTPPDIPADKYANLDLITWIHESAANNVMNSFSGMVLDEATVRGLWETELKLTSDDWKSLPPARIPAAFTLADQNPLAIRFVPQGVDIRLQATSCEIDGQVVDTGPRVLGISYRVEQDAQGLLFSRQPLLFPLGLPTEKVAVWTKILELFFGKTMRPKPSVSNSAIASNLRLDHVDVREGWLVIGAARVLTATGSSPQNLQEVLQ